MAKPHIFKPRINPALHRHPEEAAIIGRIAVAFGELEYLTVVCGARAVGEKDRLLRSLYRIRSTSNRISSADALIRPIFINTTFEADYLYMMTAIEFCYKLRNQYAHCNWADAEGHGLFFTDLEAAAQADIGFDLFFRHVDVTLLNLQEEFFANTQGYLYYFEAVIASIAGKPIYPEPPKPIALDRPIPHNPPQEHVPPWLSKDQQVLHLARAVAANGGPPTPTLKQQALDKATAEKRARQAAQRAKSDEGHRRAKARSDPDLR